ncbi:phenylalanine--tRNA ligase subunit beta [Desulfurispira natronophila]|uniref:Phenylalanine--tRNA ligase beta subunit n=1 Tax=Desulfurispira natronophila TaxID=682562 RepID=A0A7W7Y4U8_9BACT|nr:phenylalanine--tRNA ligase subunit beta [Desulfurispira natronophila]MBB5022039.1 phenylalanyl-tRNA synthetase beta chain [Desulfurispira natronophila]
MKVSYNWLQEFTAIDSDPQALADQLTLQGLEVDALSRFGNFSHIVVGRIERIDSHPNADKLTVCSVDSGQGEPLSIVCGADNMKVGDLVPVALPGACLPGGMKIKATKLRGVPSAGMLCSKSELELEEQSAGLFILPADAPVGMEVSRYLQMDDTAIEIGLTPNRSDCLSHIGVAREVGVFTGQSVTLPLLSLQQSDLATSELVTVDIEDGSDCPRYMARVVQGVKVQSSPQWLQNRLVVCGIRPINNIVDITNYIMLGLGHPLHAFDYDKLAHKRILVRRAQDGEKILTLDDQQRTLSREDLVITDGQSPVAIAGIMGGAETSIDEQSVNVLIEAASFHGSVVRKTARKLALHSESSHRFERGVDPNGCQFAIDYAAQLMVELGGGTIARDAVDNYQQVNLPRSIELRVPRLRKLLGIEISSEQAGNILQRLGMQVTAGDAEVLRVEVPTSTGDIYREVDLMEEVARIYGYGNVPATLPAVAAIAPQHTREEAIYSLKQTLAGIGYMECINYSFTSATNLERVLGPATRVQLLNALSEELAVMRTSLLPSLLLNVKSNLHLGLDSLRFMEISNVPRDHQDARHELPTSRLLLGGVLCGHEPKQWWNQQGQELSYFHLKGDLEYLLRQLGLSMVTRRSSLPWLHPGIGADIVLNGKSVGYIGEVHPTVQESFDIPVRIMAFELELEPLLAAGFQRAYGFSEISRFPSTWRDLAFVVDADVTHQAIVDAIEGVSIAHLEGVRLFDSYTLESGQKSLAYRLVFRDHTRTLTDEIVQGHIDAILKVVNQQTGAVLR